MAAGTVTLSYSTTSNGATSATVRVTMTYYGNGETWDGAPSSNNCWIKLNGTTKYFTHSYTTSSSAQSMGYADFTITKTHATQSFTATGGITGYSTVYSNPTGSCSVSVSPKTSYVITYKNNGRGNLSKSTDTKWYGETLTLASAPSNPGTGWSFQGWSTSASATSGATTYSTNGANTVYAIWKKTITLSYNANDGSNAPASQSNTIYNSTSTTSFTVSTDEPTRSNYNFTGWNTQAGGGGTSYAKGSTISNVSSDTTLYAQWQVAYNPPTFVNNPVAWRTDDAGTLNTGSGSYAKVRFSWTKASDASGTLGTTATIEWKLSTAADSAYANGTVASNISTTNYESPTRFGGSFDADTQYTIRVSLKTTGHDTIYAYTFISTESFVIDVNEEGTGIGFLSSAPTTGILLGGSTQINSDVTLFTPGTGESPHLIFQRKDLNDNYNDWRIYDKSGYLYFGHRGSGSTTWPTSQEWSINTSGKFSGNIDWDHINNIPMTGYIIDSGMVENTNGSNTQWRWIKYSNGIGVTWGWCRITPATSSWTVYLSGQALYYSPNLTVTLPITFSSTKYVAVADLETAGSNFGWIGRKTNYTTSSFDVNIIKNGNTGTMVFDVIAWGPIEV